MKIGDGKGRGRQMSVSDANRGNVSSKSNPRNFYISRDEGLAFIAISVAASIEAGQYLFYLKNTSSTKNLFIKDVIGSAVNEVLWKVWEVSGTASGSDITIENLNLIFGRSADVVCKGNGPVTGLTTVGLKGVFRHPANEREHEKYEDALILGPNSAVAVEYDTGTTGAAEVSMIFHLEDIARSN